jgi:S-adenosylmethionine decarboxylase proenzyme
MAELERPYKHVLGTLTGTIVTTVEQLKVCMAEVAEKNAFTVVGESFVQFQPFGATGVLVLAESHFSAHSYPEREQVFIDVFCCSETFDPDGCMRSIERAFGARHGAWEIVERR